MSESADNVVELCPELMARVRRARSAMLAAQGICDQLTTFELIKKQMVAFITAAQTPTELREIVLAFHVFCHAEVHWGED